MDKRVYCPNCDVKLSTEGTCRKCDYGHDRISFYATKRKFMQLMTPAALEVFPYWQFIYSGDDECKAHAVLDKMIINATNIWWRNNYPWGCKCRISPVIEHELKHKGLRISKSPPENYYDWIDPKTGKNHKIPQGTRWPHYYIEWVEFYDLVCSKVNQANRDAASRNHKKQAKYKGCMPTSGALIGIIIIIFLLYQCS